MDGLTDEQRIEAWKSCWEKALVGMAIVREDGTFHAVNDQWVKMLGVPASEFYGNTWQSLTPPEDRYQDEAQARLVAKGQIDSYEMDKSYIFKNGKQKYVRLLVTRIPMDTTKPFLFFLSRIVLRKPARPRRSSKSNTSGRRGSGTSRTGELLTQILDFLVKYWLWLAVASAAIAGVVSEYFQLGFF